MSLLNDALRAAEQRQDRSSAPDVYVGQGVKDGRSWLVPVLVLLVALLAAVASYAFWLQADRSSSGLVRETIQPVTVAPALASQPALQPEPTPEPEPERPAASQPEVTAFTKTDAALAPEVVPESETDPQPVATLQISENTAASDTTMDARQSVSEPRDSRKPDAVTATANQSKKSGAAEPARTESVTRFEAQEVEPSPSVKQVRETPEVIDQRVSRELTAQLRAGNFGAAERRLAELTRQQAGAISRAVFAREMLVQGMPEKALQWLPKALSSQAPELRLLRARALLMQGDLAAAVAVLAEEVPPVQAHIEYRVTLATLLQQSGRNQEAARHWSALIAVDDSRAAWWVGLAISLEAQGSEASAVRAYSQAANLPGLSPSLTDYVRERLSRLQAG